MSDFDLDRLGDVWRQQPGPAEMERLQRTAAAVSRRARFSQVIDVGAALIVSGVVMLLVSLNPTVSTMAMGGAAIVVLLVGQIRQRQLRQVELKSLTGSTEEMLDQSVAQIEAALNRSRFMLITFAPAMLLGWIFMNAVTGRPVRALLPALNETWGRTMWTAGLFLVLAAGAAYILRAIRGFRRDLDRVRALRDAYRTESESGTP